MLSFLLMGCFFSNTNAALDELDEDISELSETCLLYTSPSPRD